MTTMPSKPTSDKPPVLGKAEALTAISRAEALLSDLLSSPSLERSAYQRGREVMNGLRAATKTLRWELNMNEPQEASPLAPPKVHSMRALAESYHHNGKTGETTVTLKFASDAKYYRLGQQVDDAKGNTLNGVVTKIDRDNGTIVVGPWPAEPPAPSTVYCHACKVGLDPTYDPANMKVGMPHGRHMQTRTWHRGSRHAECTSPLQAEHWDAKKVACDTSHGPLCACNGDPNRRAKPKDCRCSTDDSYHLAGCHKLKPKAEPGDLITSGPFAGYHAADVIRAACRAWPENGPEHFRYQLRPGGYVVECCKLDGKYTEWFVLGYKDPAFIRSHLHSFGLAGPLSKEGA